MDNRRPPSPAGHRDEMPRIHRDGVPRVRARRGVALLTTLALLALAAALLAGGFAAASASARAARSVRASLIAASTARRALGRVLQSWGSGEGGLVVGGMIERALPESAAVVLDAADTRVRIQRISANLFVLAADVTVPATGPPLARRRLRLIAQRSRAPDSSMISTPRPIARWPLGELY